MAAQKEHLRNQVLMVTYRNRSVEEKNLSLFEGMKNGDFFRKSCFACKIDIASTNMLMRDPLMYRVFTSSCRTGNDWKIYPMYDYALMEKRFYRTNFTFDLYSRICNAP
jgi:glutaminyl-tRNA synthetase